MSTRDAASGLVKGEVTLRQNWNGTKGVILASPRTRTGDEHALLSIKTPSNHGWGSDTSSEERLLATRAFMQLAAERLGADPDDRWVLVDQYVWQLVEPAHPLWKRGVAPADHQGICCRYMHSDYTGSYCPRPVGDKHPTLCNVHGAVEVRKERQAEERREASRLREAESQRIDRLRNDLREEWELACEVMGIEPERRGSPSTSRGDAVVDLEVLKVMLRRIVETS